MLHSSLGFHTLTLSMYMSGEKDTYQLIMDFHKYSQKEKNIRMYTKNQNLVIKFYRNDRGIKWEICRNVYLDIMGMSFDAINVTINPKILSRTVDYITAASYYEMDDAIMNFNDLMKQISPLLKTFACYELKRIDYCVNLDIGELAPDCSPEQVMKLIRRGDIPPHYREWAKYDSTAHRSKSKPESFYLINKSVNINCYSKYMQLQERSRKNEKIGYPPIPQSTLNAAENIIRFEVQCKYHKTYTLSHKLEKTYMQEYNKYKELLSPLCCAKIISNYYKRVIYKGDWYTLSGAIHIIESRHFNAQKEKRLIHALKSVNHYRSLAKTKTLYEGDELYAFKRTLNELSKLNINPVTIPKEWGIKHIPNLLRTYFDKQLENFYISDPLGNGTSVQQEYIDYIKGDN